MNILSCWRCSHWAEKNGPDNRQQQNNHLLFGWVTVKILYYKISRANFSLPKAVVPTDLSHLFGDFLTLPLKVLNKCISFTGIHLSSVVEPSALQQKTQTHLSVRTSTASAGWDDGSFCRTKLYPFTFMGCDNPKNIIQSERDTKYISQFWKTRCFAVELEQQIFFRIRFVWSLVTIILN